MAKEISLHQLRLYIAVAEELHFHRAAAKMHVAQPPLTRHIQDLERAVGVHLLDRTSRNVKLTPAGEAFLDGARKVLRTVDATAAKAAQVAANGRKLIRVGCVASVAIHLMPRAMIKFYARYPEITVEVYENHTRLLDDMLQRGEIDIAIVRPPVSNDQVRVRFLYADALVLAIPEAQPAQDPANLSDYAESSFICHDRSLGTAVEDAALQTCVAAGFIPRVSAYVGNTSMLFGLVAAGKGISMLPAPYALLQPYGIRFVRIREESGSCGVILTWREDDDQDPVFVSFRRAVDGAVTEMLRDSTTPG